MAGGSVMRENQPEVFNQLQPSMVYASELTLFPDTPLSVDVTEGKFTERNWNALKKCKNLFGVWIRKRYLRLSM